MLVRDTQRWKNNGVILCSWLATRSEAYSVT